MTEQSVTLLGKELAALEEYRCRDCGGSVVAKNEVAADAFREYVATGQVEALCDDCRVEVGGKHA
ncbi:MAG: hypothetical protein ACOC8X_10155 [Chloroflexota bacterium]